MLLTQITFLHINTHRCTKKNQTISLKLLIILLFNYAVFFLVENFVVLILFVNLSILLNEEPSRCTMTESSLACLFLYFFSYSTFFCPFFSLPPSRPANPTDRSTKNLLFVHHIAESDIKNGRVFFYFLFFKLQITKGAVQRKERQQGKQKGWKVREGLNPGIKISHLFFYTLPLPHSNCS